MEYFTFNDGQKYPVIALGTVRLQGAVGIQKIHTALEAGYRAFDSSTNYHNEGMLGEAIRRSPIPREEIQVTSKLPGQAHEYDRAIVFIQESLYRMGLDYFDKYLIHWPLPMQDQYVEAWQALIDAQKFGLIKSIGVSNFHEQHLDRLVEETGVVPATNQIERHPYFNNLEVHRANQKHGIVTESWSPFGRGTLNNVLENETMQKLAEKHGKDIAQVILRWNYQEGILSNPRSGSFKHQKSNLDIFDFELSKEDMETINSLDKGEAGRVEGQNPEVFEEYV